MARALAGHGTETRRAGRRRVRRRPRLRAPLAAAVALAGLAAGLFIWRTAGPETAPTGGPASGRVAAASAAYRGDPGPETAAAYAAALYMAGGFEALRRLVADPETPLAVDAMRIWLAGEADMRQGRYDSALAAADRAAEAAALSAQARLLRGRASYAVSASAHDAALGEIRAGFGAGDASMAPALWLFRARLALDANDLGPATAAARRAEEAGAPPVAAAAYRIEAALRDGKQVDARAALSAAASGAAGATPGAADIQRLEGLARLHEGDFVAAARAFAAARRSLAYEPRGPLLAAVADIGAQRYALAEQAIRRETVRAPRDWVAVDLLAALAAARGDLAARDDALRALASLNPGLAALRGAALAATAGGDDAANRRLDAILKAAAARPGAIDLQSAAALLAGRDVLARDTLPALAPVDRDLARLLSGGPKPAAQIAAAATAILEAERSPVTLAATGVLATEIDPGLALDRFEAALGANPGLAAAAPAVEAAALAAGDPARGLRLLAAPLEAAADDVRLRLAVARLSDAVHGPAAAVAALRPVAAALETDPEGAAFYARVLSATGEPDTARLFARRAAARLRRPLDGGTVLRAAGVEEEAAAVLRRGIIREPGDARLAEAYRAAMAALGREAEAEALLRAAATAR